YLYNWAGWRVYIRAQKKKSMYSDRIKYLLVIEKRSDEEAPEETIRVELPYSKYDIRDTLKRLLELMEKEDLIVECENDIGLVRLVDRAMQKEQRRRAEFDKKNSQCKTE
ncbi:MAG: hypothetical protein PHW33_04065, partial [Candidatus Portnoybacteria bacterium]|nr:hypothetical protein [Candidatus Portnoybacteria bacterium]